MNNIMVAQIGLFFAFFSAQGMSWQSPEPHLRYHEVCFLTAHNAYASIAHGYRYAQQRLSLKEQLAAGVRGLMLDTHLDTQNHVVLLHRNETVTRAICGVKSPMHLREALDTIKTFLDAHPTEIITIFLENYVIPPEVIDEPFIKAGLKEYVLSPSDWNPVKEQGWPTIGWMQKHNKRLLIFDSLGETTLAFNQWQHSAENQWGALALPHACKERWESKVYRKEKRYLYILNYFPKIKFNFGRSYATINSSMLEEFIAKASNGLKSCVYKHRLPNFLSIDFIDEGSAMEHVLAINRKAADALQRPLQFRLLQ